MKMVKYMVWLLSLVVLSACDSILDKGPLDRFTDDNFWTGEGNVTGYANLFYEQFLGYGNGTGQGDFYFNTLSDDQVGGMSFAKWTYDNPPASSGSWNNGWIEIRRANIMIEKVPDIVSMDEVTKNHWLGVARLMRAWQYYHMVRIYGDVPWIDKSLNVTDEGEIYGPREDRDGIMDKVLGDLDFAVANIKDENSKISWSRSLAQAMKAEVCLYEGTFRKYRRSEDGQKAPDGAGATKFLQACKDACLALMNKGWYHLNESYQGNYNSIDLSGNPEMIFYKAYEDPLLKHSTIDYTCGSTKLSGMSKDAFEAYLFTDGKPMALTSLDNTDVAPFEYGHLSLKNILSVRDKRLSQTIDTVLLYNKRGFVRFNQGVESTSSTGYGVAKFDNENIPVLFRNQGNSNYTDAPLFWLSVIYLDYAEACAELGSITQADLDNSVNKLKQRAGLPPLTVDVGFEDPANNMRISALIWEIRRERRCELMFDGRRYWDLIRWHQLDKLDTKKYPDIIKGANLTNDLTEEVIKSNDMDDYHYLDGSKGDSRIFENKHYLYPIPTGQIDLNDKLTQNPGW